MDYNSDNLNIQEQSIWLGDTLALTVIGAPDIFRGDKIDDKEIKERHSYRECGCCGDGNLKTLLTLDSDEKITMP